MCAGAMTDHAGMLHVFQGKAILTRVEFTYDHTVRDLFSLVIEKLIRK